MGHCHCGCSNDIKYVKSASKESRISLYTSGLTINQIDQLLGLNKDFGATFTNGNAFVSVNFKNSMISDIITYLQAVR
jgi:hypothetical protein